MTRPRANTALRGAAVLLLLGAVSGCIGLGKKTPPTLLTLSAAQTAPAGAAASGAVGDAIMVMEPETDRRLGVLRIPVQVDASQVAYLKDAQWVERPSRLLRALLAETLRARGGRLVLEDNQAATNPGTRLAGRLMEMGYDARAMAVVVRYDAIRTDARDGVATRRFEAKVSGISADPDQVGPALNQAANEVANQVADWMAR